jgi:hypothetical protein
MKKIALFVILLIGISLMFSCEKKDATPVLDMSQAKPAAITEPSSEAQFILTQENADSIMTTFKWSPVNYNLDNLEKTKYSLQIDLADSNFVNAVELVNTTETSFAITVGQMNSVVVPLGLETGVPGTVEIRIFSYLNTDTDVSYLYSDAISLTITPYEGIVDYPKLWVPGDYQGWNPAEAPNIYDFDNDGVFTGYIYMPEGGTYEFKFTSAPDWAHINYGAGADEGTLDTDGGAPNLSVPGPGGYYVTVDVNNLTWTYELQNWGVIGEWLGWAEDIDMLWDAENQQLYVTVENIPAAENQCFKYRANDSWDLNLGANDPDDGTLVPGGANIPIPNGGTLTFYLRFTTPLPTYEVKEN